MKKITIIIVVVVVALAAAAFAIWRYINIPYDGAELVRVNIPADTDAQGIHDILTETLGNDYGSHVSVLWERQGGRASAAHGSYLVKPGQSALSLSRAMVNGHQTPVRLTYNNLRTFGQLAARVGNTLELDSADFVAACDTILPKAGFEDARQFPAAFMPDTYEFYWTARPDYVVNKLLEHRNKYWNDERRTAAKMLGLTPVQVATLASIVEEETNMSDEKGRVARMYLNRIDRDMPLQADPTVKFALGDFGLRRITGSHLNVDSPYNTYRIQGLPPGPIRIADGRTIDSVLSAPKHNYLYMCARSDFSGYHDFAETYDRHRINAARYHMALNRRGIK